MKKYLFQNIAAAAIIFAATSTLNAQDVITTVEGKKIEVTIVEENDDEVKYTREGSTIVRAMPVSKISKIDYEDGSHRVVKPAAKSTRNTTTQRRDIEEDDDAEADDKVSTNRRSTSNAPKRRAASRDSYSDNDATQYRTPANISSSRNNQRTSTSNNQYNDNRVSPPSYDDDLQPRDRRGYVGLALGSSSLAFDGKDALTGFVFGINAGYLFSRRVGLQTSIMASAPIDADYDFTTSMVAFGPLFSFGSVGGSFAFDLRPSLAYMSNNRFYPYDTVTSWGIDLGATARWKLRSIAFNSALDIAVADFVMVAVTLGFDFRIP